MTGQHGSAAIELVAGTGLLVLPAVLLVLSLPAWAQTHTMARAAAREAARVVVLADDPGSTEAVAAARRAAAEVATNHGRTLTEPVRFEWSQRQVEDVDGFLRQPTVAATVTVRMPAVVVPLIGEWAAFDWSVTHGEPVDAYRSRAGP